MTYSAFSCHLLLVSYYSCHLILLTQYLAEGPQHHSILLRTSANIVFIFYVY